VAVSLVAVAGYFLRLGLTGFGGPVALANHMRRDFVERYDWLSPAEYDEGLAIATACPGPLAYQLGVYCGYVMLGVRGALTAALAFAAAPFAIVTGAAYLYVSFGTTWVFQGLFFGVAPVVVALIVRSCWDLGRKTLRGEGLAFIFAGIACAITILVQKELTALFVAAGALGIVLFYKRAPEGPSSVLEAGEKKRESTLPAIASLTTLLGNVPLSNIFWFFFKTGFLIFGSGLVVVPFLKAYVVDQYHWLSNQAFVDAVAVGIISPGPVVITATFVGYLVHGFYGAVAATVGMFAPSIIFVLVGTPLLRKYRQNGRVQGFIRGVTVAVVGVLVGTSFLVAKSSIHGWIGAALLLVALALILSKWRIPDQALIGGGALTGLTVAFFSR
jgi:chromate transporter